MYLKMDTMILKLHLLLIILIIFQGTRSEGKNQVNLSPQKKDSVYTISPQQAYMDLRGLERDERSAFRPVKMLWGVVSYMPNQVVQGLRFASGYGAGLLNDPKFIDRVEGLLFSDDKSLGWYPVVSITSGFRPRVGISLSYRNKPVGGVLKCKYADGEKYSVTARFSYVTPIDSRIWRFTLSGLTEYDDDRVFYGIGAYPKTDPRSYFLSTSQRDFGIYFQQSSQIQALAGVRTSKNWQWFFTTSYQSQTVSDPFEGTDLLSESFDVAKLPGLNGTIDMFYNEVSLRYDNRNPDIYESKGFKIESYFGLSQGKNNNRIKLLRAGFDILGNFPVIQDNRMLIPRIVFRGASTRKLFRIDYYSIVPSIEYQWPLAFNLGGHLFLDLLMVTKDLPHASSRGLPYALGFGIDFHVIDGELARLQCAAGNAGYYISFEMGLDVLLPNRSENN